MSERCERMSERISEWPSTYVLILGFSKALCIVQVLISGVDFRCFIVQVLISMAGAAVGIRAFNLTSNLHVGVFWSHLILFIGKSQRDIVSFFFIGMSHPILK